LIQTVSLTHFHADHLVGLRDLPRARFVFAREAYEAVRGKRGLAAVKAGFLPGLLPHDFEARAVAARPPRAATAARAAGSVPRGHRRARRREPVGAAPARATGQIWAADAGWLSRQVRERLHELHRARPDVAILPSHCPDV